MIIFGILICEEIFFFKNFPENKTPAQFSNGRNQKIKISKVTAPLLISNFVFESNLSKHIEALGV